eukprot:jgi/Mesvir1/14723/Mv05371-RA.1
MGTIKAKRGWQQQLKGQHDWKRRKMKRKLEKKKRHWKEGKQDRCTYAKGVHYEEGGAGDEDGDVMDIDARLCMFCGGPTHTTHNPFLICGGTDCVQGAHMLCTGLTLKTVPKGEWYCQDCEPGDAYSDDE